MTALADLQKVLTTQPWALLCKLNSAQLWQRVQNLTIQLHNKHRVVCCSDDAATVLTAVLAGQVAMVDIVLLRQSPSHVDLQSLGVDGVLQEDGRVVGIGTTPTVTKGTGLLLVATSGTTGTPKIATHVFSRLVDRVRIPKEPAKWLLSYHPASFAGLQVLLTALYAKSMLIAPEEQTLASLLYAAQEHQVTHISATPTFWRGLLRMPVNIPLVSITLGGERTEQSLLNALSERFPQAFITHIYASTEAGVAFTVTDKKAGFPAAWLHSSPNDTALRIVDEQLEVRSQRSMIHYAIGDNDTIIGNDGWLRTGDTVHIEGDRVYFTGRADKALNIGGAKVMPEEIEEAMLQVAGVADARVYGAKNPISGTIVAAEVVANDNIDTDVLRRLILSDLRNQLAPYKIPRVITFVKSITLTSTGKKQRV
jgi:acyl-CoA synthetase (AMP-forming)/AMP-acid ligase II